MTLVTGMKHVGRNIGNPPTMLPSPPAAYPPLPLPGMPFVSPYQINLMHQAAVQMALASQIQSNATKLKEAPAAHVPLMHNANVKLLPTDLYYPTTHHSPTQHTPDSASQPDRSPPALVKTIQPFMNAKANVFQ